MRILKSNNDLRLTIPKRVEMTQDDEIKIEQRNIYNFEHSVSMRGLILIPVDASVLWIPISLMMLLHNRSHC